MAPSLVANQEPPYRISQIIPNMIGTVQVNGEDGKGHRLKAREQASKSSQRGEKHTGSVLSNHTINDGGFDSVDDVVACAGYKVSISANLYIFLFDTFQRQEAAA